MCCNQYSSYVPSASETEHHGHVMVRNNNTNEELNYFAIMKNGEIFISSEDIANILDLDVSVYEDEIVFTEKDHMFLLRIFLDLERFQERWGEWGLDKLEVKEKGFVRVNGVNYFLDIINKDNAIFLPLEKMLYLCHAQWSVEDNKIVVSTPKMTLLDFADQYAYNIRENAITSENINDVSSAMSSSLALAFNNFDYKILIPIWGANEIVNETFKEALLQLTNEDTKFLSENTQTVRNLLGENYYTEAKSSFDNFKNIVDIPSNLNDIKNLVSQTQNANPSTMFNKFNDVSFLTDAQYKELSDYLDTLDTVVKVAA